MKILSLFLSMKIMPSAMYLIKPPAEAGGATCRAGGALPPNNFWEAPNCVWPQSFQKVWNVSKNDNILQKNI